MTTTESLLSQILNEQRETNKLLLQLTIQNKQQMFSHGRIVSNPGNDENWFRKNYLSSWPDEEMRTTTITELKEPSEFEKMRANFDAKVGIPHD